MHLIYSFCNADNMFIIRLYRTTFILSTSSNKNFKFVTRPDDHDNSTKSVTTKKKNKDEDLSFENVSILGAAEFVLSGIIARLF